MRSGGERREWSKEMRVGRADFRFLFCHPVFTYTNFLKAMQSLLGHTFILCLIIVAESILILVEKVKSYQMCVIFSGSFFFFGHKKH